METIVGHSLTTLVAVFAVGLLVGFIMGKMQSAGDTKAGSMYGPAPHVVASGGPFAEPSSAVQDLIRRNQLIEAIKVYREETGEGLKESKDAVEDWKRRNC